MTKRQVRAGMVILLLFILTLAAVIAYGPRLYVVTSGSMTPAIPVGSMILVSRADFSDIREGHIITYHLNGSPAVVTHRVVSVDEQGRDLCTKGDANEHRDPISVSQDQVIGVVRVIVPYLGILWVRAGRLWPALLLILSVACTGSIWRRKTGKEKDYR